MHVHVLSNLFPPEVLGGYELLAADVTARLQERGHRVRVVTTGAAHTSDPPVVSRTLRLARRFGSVGRRDRLRHLVTSVYNRAALARLLAAERPDAVLVMSLRRLGLEPLRAYASAGVPAVVTVNDDWPLAYPAAARGVRALLDGAPWSRHAWGRLRVERAVYLSESLRQTVRAAGVPLPDGEVRAQGVPAESFPPRPFRPLTGSLRLLFVGRLHPSKAPEVAIDALAALRRDGVEATLTLAGAPVDAAYDASLRARAAPLGERVRFLGGVPRGALSAVYREADVFLFPCAWDGEGQGLTYLEAMASGVPVVAFPRGGAADLLRDRPVYQRAAANTGEAFAAAIRALQADTPAQAAMVAAASVFLHEHASLDAYVSALEANLDAAAAARALGDHVRGR